MLSKRLYVAVYNKTVLSEVDTVKSDYEDQRVYVNFKDPDSHSMCYHFGEVILNIIEWITKQGYGTEILHRLNTKTGELVFIEISLYSGQFEPDFFNMDEKILFNSVCRAGEWVLEKINESKREGKNEN